MASRFPGENWCISKTSGSFQLLLSSARMICWIWGGGGGTYSNNVMVTEPVPLPPSMQKTQLHYGA